MKDEGEVMAAMKRGREEGAEESGEEEEEDEDSREFRRLCEESARTKRRREEEAAGQGRKDNCTSDETGDDEPGDDRDRARGSGDDGKEGYKMMNLEGMTKGRCTRRSA